MEDTLLKRQTARPKAVPLPEVPPTRRKGKLRATELSELSEQALVVSALRKAGYLLFAVPNGHVRSKRQSIQAKLEGVSAGVPDFIIIDPPPARPDLVGTVVEMKRAHAVPSDLRDSQVSWLTAFERRRWAVMVGLGADDALVKLRSLGYRV